MKTIQKNKKVAAAKIVPAAQDNSEIIVSRIPLALIDYSPINHRTIYSQKALEEFAIELAIHGVLHAIILRPIGERYELVIGERRVRSSRIADLDTIPAQVKVLSDKDVRELQLSENIQREDPHPLQQAQGILMMQEDGHSIDEISARLGKSKAFIYSRMKIAQLIKPLQQVFISDKMSMQDAWNLANLSATSQQDFFNDHCGNWEDDNFRLTNLRSQMSRYRYDLKAAPFDTKDKKLVEGAAACGNCPFNSATLKTLFPEMAKEAFCNNMACYKAKCQKAAENRIVAAAKEIQPQAILIGSGGLSEEERMLVDSLPETTGLEQFNRYYVRTITPPVLPDKNDYLEEDEDDPERTVFDEAGYQEAVQEYEADQAIYEAKIAGEETVKGLLIDKGKVALTYFVNYGSQNSSLDSDSKPVTAKQIQEAIKAKSATPELLQKGIERIEERETRLKELDRVKVQEKVHDAFLNRQQEEQPDLSLTPADQVAVRLIVYQSLTYQVRNKVDSMLFPDCSGYPRNQVHFYEALSAMCEEDFVLLLRMALAGNNESRLPENINGITLYRVAEAAGTDVAAIEQAQADRAKDRGQKSDLRIKELQARKEQLAIPA